MGDTRRVRFDADGGGAAGGGGGGDGGGGDGERKAADDEKTTALHPARFADGQTGKDVGGSAARRFRVNLGQRSRFGVDPSRFLSLSLSLWLVRELHVLIGLPAAAAAAAAAAGNFVMKPPAGNHRLYGGGGGSSINR